MMPHLGRALSSLLLICLILSSTAQDEKKEEKPFPSIKKYTFYSTEVQMTDLEQGVAVFASEYYDPTGGPRGRLDIVSPGSERTVIYNQNTDQIIELTPTTCEVWGTDESEYYYEPPFETWLNKDPLVIGPSAALWLAEAERENIVYESASSVRDIDCEAWKYNYKTVNETLTITFHFAATTWATPYSKEGETEQRVPIRIEVSGQTNRDSDTDYPVNIHIDFFFFRPTIPNFQVFQPPEGIGCQLKKETRTMPTMPKKYRYSAEVVDLIQARKAEVEDIEFRQVWYDSIEKLARLDRYTRQNSISELYDFNSGVTYSVKDSRSCSINPLKNSFFEAYDDEMVGHFKKPNEAFNLQGSFYFLGTKAWRGMWVDIFESVRTNEFTDKVVFKGESLSKMIVTVYYTQEFLEVAVTGETEERIPVYYAVKGWDAENKNELIIDEQYNIFGFDDEIYPDLYASFGLQECFPSLDDKSYFLLVMETNRTVAALMEGQDDFILQQLGIKISEIAQISYLRLPLLKADYTGNGVNVQGLMLDRPPALKQFWLIFDKLDSIPTNKVGMVEWAKTKENCAFECINEREACYGFYWCKDACFVKDEDITKTLEGNDNIVTGDTCEEWIRAEMNSTNKEAYLADALKLLEDAVLDSKLSVTVLVGEDLGHTTVDVSEIAIGDGPYIGVIGQDKPYTVVAELAKLDPGAVTTEAREDIDNLFDCYLACKNTEDLSCSSFSYCDTAENKQCVISSVLVLNRTYNDKDIKQDPKCVVYSMKYLDFFMPYPGRLTFIPGEKVFENVPVVEECAKKCRTITDINCRGFEHCQSSKTCVLHTKHILDLEPGEVVTNTKNKGLCTHYAARYAADYKDSGLNLVAEMLEERQEISLEDCAKACSQELKDKCQSFNYCPASGLYSTDGACSLSSFNLKTTATELFQNKPCHHYEKRSGVDDWTKEPEKKKPPPPPPSGYTKGQFTWLVVGMLIFGFVLGAIGFTVFSYYRSKGSDTGMTVRFMKQGNL